MLGMLDTRDYNRLDRWNDGRDTSPPLDDIDDFVARRFAHFRPSGDDAADAATLDRLATETTSAAIAAGYGEPTYDGPTIESAIAEIVAFHRSLIDPTDSSLCESIGGAS